MENKTDLRIIKTYRSLHLAFTELLMQKRFENITVNELCDRALIRRTTFYKHFADKYEYFTFYIKELRDVFQSQLAPDIASERTEIYFVNMSRELFHFMAEHKPLVLHIIESHMENVLFDLLYDLVRSDMRELISAEHTEESKTELNITAAFYAGGLLCALRWWVESRIEVSEDSFVAAVGKLMTTSLSSVLGE